MNVSPTQQPQQSQNTTPKKSLDKDAFLTLFVKQLQMQDPFNPMDAKDSSAQLAQFSQLEQTTEMNKTLTSLLQQSVMNSVNNAVSYIGKDVVAAGYGISKKGEQVSNVSYNIPKDAASVKAHIYDNKNNLIQTINLGGKQAGDFTFSWNGNKSTGAKALDGNYTVAFEARDQNGELIQVTTKVSGKVASVSVENGQVMLKLEDGRQVPLNNVSEIKNTPQQSQNNEA